MIDDSAARRKGIYHQVYFSRVASAISACRTVTALSHSGEKGRIREILIRSLFRPLLPADLGVGSGFILSCAKQISNQQDVILYDRSIVPPAMFDDDTGFFPIESVLHTIEIKSCLDIGGLRAAHASAKEVAKFQLLGVDGKPTLSGPRPTSSIFALATDLKEGGKKEDERYAELRGDDPPFLGYICVVNCGYWWHSDGSCRAWPERHPYAEVFGFLTGIMNVLPKVYEERRRIRPPIGAYLSDFGSEFDDLFAQISSVTNRVRDCLAREPRDSTELRRLQTEALELRQKIDDTFMFYQGEEIHEVHRRALASCNNIWTQVGIEQAKPDKPLISSNAPRAVPRKKKRRRK
ncbi:DUF6602 domain-containing protein [Sorangium sp. So ce134]